MKFFKSLYTWILIFFILGCLFGIFFPKLALEMEPLGTNFVKLIKIFIGPIVFLTVAKGIAQTGSLTKLGKISLKAFIYFEIVSTIALLLGWLAATFLKPGLLMHVNIQQLESQNLTTLTHTQHTSFMQFWQNLIPANLVEPLIKGDILQILVLAILFGIALLSIPNNQATKITDKIEALCHILFRMFKIVLYAAPIGVFGAISSSMAKYGLHFLIPLAGLLGTFYLTAFIFLFGILGSIAKISGFSLLKFIQYFAPELFLILGTASSETALPQLLSKLEKLGCKKETVGVVVPLGYSFNTDGTNIYITLAALFIAQALGIHLTLVQQITLFAMAMLASKGAAGVSGAGLITLAAILAIIPSIPAADILLVLGVDRFMNEGRSVINFIGNGVGSLAISRWQNDVSPARINNVLTTGGVAPLEEDCGLRIED